MKCIIMYCIITGKGGRNVRHIQDISDAIVKLPDDQDPDSEDVPVQVIGNIYSQTVSTYLLLNCKYISTLKL